MKLVTITANSAAEALAQVHRQLGPEAVIVNVRKTAPPGISGIFKKPLIEVQATLPVRPEPKAKKSEWLDLHKKVTQLKKQLDAESLEARRDAESADELRSSAEPEPARDYTAEVRASLRAARERQREQKSGGPSRGARQKANAPVPSERRKTESRSEETDQPLNLAQMLENLGIVPLNAQWLADQVRSQYAGYRFENLREEFTAAQEFLVEYWNRLSEHRGARGGDLGKSTSEAETRILVGAPGVGKTTCICKWLTQEVLMHNRAAKVWRLDANSANTAEFLSIHGEILGVPVERVWNNDVSEETGLVQFVDLPGIAVDDPQSISAVAKQIQDFNPAQVFLVLNAAYDLSHLLSQVRAYSPLKIHAIILTHTDEETRWSKFWNIFLGTKLPMVFLSGGQNIPGNFSPATPQGLFEVEVE